jgi:uncharacterized protein DUF4398
MSTRQDNWRLAAPALLGLALALAACAQPSPPSAEIRSAREAIARAEENGARALAPQQLQTAQDKLSQAQSAVQQSEMQTARYLAEESEVDADLAASSSNAQRVANTANELQGAQKRIEPRR